jgi:hypothetical protein
MHCESVVYGLAMCSLHAIESHTCSLDNVIKIRKCALWARVTSSTEPRVWPSVPIHPPTLPFIPILTVDINRLSMATTTQSFLTAQPSAESKQASHCLIHSMTTSIEGLKLNSKLSQKQLTVTHPPPPLCPTSVWPAFLAAESLAGCRGSVAATGQPEEQ